MGPFSDAVATNGVGGRLLFLSGQLGTLPGAAPGSTRFAGPDTASQARQALRNIQAVLAAAGADLSRVVNCTVLLADIRDIAEINAVYAEFFERPYPARLCCQVANLPASARVEIIAVAELPPAAKI